MEHDHCNTDKLKCKTAFLWKLFIVSFIFFGLSVALMLCCHDFWKEYVTHMWKIPPESYEQIIIYCFTFWKILIIQFPLIPAIAMTLAVKCHEKKEK